MSESFDRLRQIVLADVAVRRAQQQGTHTTNYGELTADFLRATLKRQGMSVKDFAAALHIKADVAQFIVDHGLPGSMLNEDFIQRVAEVTGYTAEVLLTMWGKSKPVVEVDTEPPKPQTMPQE